MLFRTLWLGIAALAACFGVSAPGAAQTYPTQMVRIVVPFGPAA